MWILSWEKIWSKREISGVRATMRRQNGAQWVSLATCEVLPPADPWEHCSLHRETAWTQWNSVGWGREEKAWFGFQGFVKSPGGEKSILVLGRKWKFQFQNPCLGPDALKLFTSKQVPGQILEEGKAGRMRAGKRRERVGFPRPVSVMSPPR